MTQTERLESFIHRCSTCFKEFKWTEATDHHHIWEFYGVVHCRPCSKIRRKELQREMYAAMIKDLFEWDKKPIHDTNLKVIIKWINDYKEDKDPSPFPDWYEISELNDHKNFYDCECESGWIYAPEGLHYVGKTVVKKHRHRANRALEQAIKELE